MTTAQRGTLAAAILGSAIVFLDGTLVILALPRMGAQLDSTLIGQLEGQTYVTSGYLATLAAFLVLAGALGDYYGRRRMFRIGLVGFGITSVICGLSLNLELLVIGLPVDHHEHVRGAGEGSRLRGLGGRDLRSRDARAADRRDPRRRRRVARALPDQRAAPADRALRDPVHEGVA
jgi:MFS family permease